MENKIELEVDVHSLLYYLKKKIAIILAVTAIFALVAFVISAFFIAPEYRASTRVYILNRSNEQNVVSSDFSISNYMIKDYAVLITGRNVTDKVVEKLGLEMSSGVLGSKISVSALDNTRVLQISVKDKDPQLAAQIANSVREEAAIQIKQIMDVDAVNLVYEAKIPTAPVSPNVREITLLWAAIGLLLAVGVFVVIFVTDDAIRTEEDAERYLGLATLGAIPVSNDLDTGIKKAKRPGDRLKIGGGFKWKR